VKGNFIKITREKKTCFPGIIFCGSGYPGTHGGQKRLNQNTLENFETDSSLFFSDTNRGILTDKCLYDKSKSQLV